MVPHALDAASGQQLDVAVMGFSRRAVEVRVQSEVPVPVIGLCVLLFPLPDLGGVYEHRVLVRVDPRPELVQYLVVGVLAHTGIVSIVPVVHPTDEVLTADVPVGEECAAMKASSVQHGDVVVVADDHEIDVLDQGVRRLPVLELAPGGHFGSLGVDDGKIHERRTPC